MDQELAAKVSRDAFEERYAITADPWNFATSPYEQNRYDCVIRALSKTRYDVVYEPGCSVGVLTARLAKLAHQVIAADIAAGAVAQARTRCIGMKNVDVLCADVGTYLPALPLELIVFSEIGYYFETGNLARIATALADRLQPRGEFVAVHWLGHSEDHVLHGMEVHETLRRCLPLAWVKGETHEHFRIDSWTKA